MNHQTIVAMLSGLFVNVALFISCSTIASSSSCAYAQSNEQYHNKNNKVLVVGATGTTGLRAIQGLLDVGYPPHQLKLITRSVHKPNMMKLKQIGFDVVQADLDDPSTLINIGKDCSGCYVHAFSSDTAELDTKEVERAKNLCSAIILCEKDNDDEQLPTISTIFSVQCVVYNSAAAAPDHGVKRIQQKHDIEKVFQTAIIDRLKREAPSSSQVPQFTSLRANLFMEELWKKYTRPQILAGKYPLPVHRRRKIYLVSVRDMGQLAGAIMIQTQKQKSSFLQQKESRTSSSTSLVAASQFSHVLNIAGDCLTGPQIATAFAKSQNSAVRYFNPRWFTFKARLKFRELYEQMKFMQTSKETTAIEVLKTKFPGIVLTSFEEFLDETSWSNRTKTFENFADPRSLIIGRNTSN